MSALWKAMLEAQKKIENVKTDSKNPHFKSNYASLATVLDSIRPVLNDCGLVLTQQIRSGAPPGFVIVQTMVTHAASGESTKDSQAIPVAKSDPQGFMAAVTYARRGGIKCMFGIAEEDDDGNTASAKPTPVIIFEKKTEPADPKKTAEVMNKLEKATGWKPLNG